jgi:hypothetical protein
VVLERANGTFGRVDTVFFGRHALEENIIFREGFFEVGGTLVIKDV